MFKQVDRVVRMTSVGLIAGALGACTLNTPPPTTTMSSTLLRSIHQKSGCWDLRATDERSTVHVSPPNGFVLDLTTRPLGGDTWGQWVKDAGTLDFQAVAVYDVTSSADANADALSAGASTFLWQSWGPAKVDLENIESWAGVPGGLTGHQIYPTESTRNAKRRDNRFWLVPVGPSRFVVGVSAPEGAHAAELAQAVAASIGAGPCP